MRRLFCLLPALAASACLVLPARAAEPALDPALPYRAKKSGPVAYEVEFVAAVTAPAHTKLLRVWVPVPQTDAAQEVTGSRFSTFPTKVKPAINSEKKFGNKFAYFEFKNPEGAQIIRHCFKVRVSELHWDIDPAKVQKVDHWPAAFDRYRQGDHTVEVSNALKELLPKVVPESKGEYSDLVEVMSWVNGHLTYDHVNASLRASSKHALDQRRGHCSDYHGLCAAFGRALGYPTRVCYGINPFPKSSPSHCKLEVYLPPHGWVSFDVSETQNLIAAINKAKDLTPAKKAELVKAARDRLRSGFRDNTWYMQTRGTDYDLAPPANKRAAVVRTIYAEADGVALPDPDPSAKGKTEFAWMTAHRYTPDRKVTYPFKDWKSLRK
jgi:transglutaminase-like putative cysteine protease